MTDKQKCILTETISAGRPSYHFIMIALEGGVLMVGANIKPGARARIRIDEQAAIETTQCDSSMCYFTPQQKAVAVSQMRRGSRIRADFRGIRGGEIGPLETSLSGFDEVYSKLR